MKTVINNTVDGHKSKFKLLKSVAAGCGLLLMLPSAWAQFTSLPIYEPFGEYAEGELLGTNTDSGIYWDVGNGRTNGVQSYVITAAAAMSFPALVGDPNPVPKGVMSVYINNTSADRGFMFPTNTLTSGAIYASFLLNYLNNGVATTGYAQDRAMLSLGTGASIYTNGSFGDIDASVWLTPDYRIVIDKNYRNGGAFSSPSPVIATNVPHLIVIRYEVVPGGNDEMDLWIDPMPFGDNGSIPPPTLSTTNGPNIANFNVLMLNSRKTPQYTANAFYVDEIRLGDTWSSVTPLTTPSPGPIFSVTGGGTICPSSQTDVGLSGSVTTNVYLLYTNNTYAGVSLPGTGSALDLGLQSTPAVYSVLASNTVTADIGWMSNSVTVVAIPPPTIVTEPNPVVTATNNRAEFTVGLSGSGFSYQWYQNGNPLADNTNITGAQTDDLVIWPATVANVGDYYCVISNTCGEASTTTTNSLALDAPNDLVWSGDAFGINVWAVGTTSVEEFNNGGAYFNEGDNVTFNDSYNGAQYGTNITLTNILTPTSITYDTAQELTWAGPGSIAGSGSLLVNGSGTLNLLNNSADNYANTYTGGTVISNGTVNMHNSWTGLGTGPVTLAGGTLETYQKAKGSGLLQNLYVTADSTWQVDKTGNQCAGLAGGLLGNPGTTLTISNSVSNYHSPNDIRFYGVFTNNSAIVTSIDPLATNSAMRIDAYNSTGTQVYNGAISGDTAAFFVYGAGAVYLNGANTYTNATTASAGFLAGSGSINGPLTETSGGTLGGGPEDAIGTFTVNSDVTLGGNVLIRVNKSLSPAQSNDMISATGIITNTGTGTVTITNIGTTPLVGGDTFKIFSGPVQNGDALTVTGSGMAWINNLALDGSVQVSPVITASPTITSLSVEGSNVVINGINGQAATAYLLMATNIAEPLNQWKTVATNVLGGNVFTFTGTNVVTADSPQQFFMLSSTNYNP